VEKSQTRFFHPACKSRKERAIRAFPQPRRRRVFGYISNVSTIDPKVTFLNGLTRKKLNLALKMKQRRSLLTGGLGGDGILVSPADECGFCRILRGNTFRAVCVPWAHHSSNLPRKQAEEIRTVQGGPNKKKESGRLLPLSSSLRI
jgi:hypothetical protein